MAVLAGAWMMTGASAQETASDPPVDPPKTNLAPTQIDRNGKGAPSQQPMALEGLKLPKEFKLRLPSGAAPARALAGVTLAVGLSVSILMMCLIRGLERLIRLQASAFGYIGFALVGLSLYALIGMRLLETPPDLITSKVTMQGDASLAETIAAFAQRRSEFTGDPFELDRADVYDGSVNLFLADRLEFIGGSSPLEPRRKALMVEVRDTAVAFYQEVELLGMPMVVTLLVPIEGRTNALRFGQPTARVGTWTVLPSSLVKVLWDNLRLPMAAVLDDVKFADAFIVERISDGFIHLTLRSAAQE